MGLCLLLKVVILALCVVLSTSSDLRRSSSYTKIVFPNMNNINDFPFKIGAGIYDITGPAAESKDSFSINQISKFKLTMFSIVFL